MRYTPEQYAMLKKAEHGLNINDLSEPERWVYQFLIGQKLLQPRYDIEDGLHYLSEIGKCVLAEHRHELDLLQNVAAKDAKDEEHKAFQDKVAVANVLVPLVTFILGILLEHSASIVDGALFLWELLFG